MESAREFFVHELSDMLDAERKILGILEESQEDTERDDIRKALQMHHSQTEKQIDRIEQVFDELGDEQKEAECKGIQGLKEEKQDFLKEDPSEELIEVFTIGAAAKVEHYEIASYNSLIDLATKLGLKKGIRLLQQNLREEEQMLRKVEALQKKFKPSVTGMEEGEQEETRGRSRRRAA